MSPALRSLLWPFIATCLALAVMLGLGVWQVQRLNWKNDLIAKIEARTHGAPAPLPPQNEWRELRAEAYDYTRVSVIGRFEHEREILIFRGTADGKASGAGPGYQVLTPLRLADGSHVVINRGFVPLASKDPNTRKAGLIVDEVKITGLMRAPEARNAFTPPDNPAKNEWFTRDPAKIAAHFGLEKAAPFAIDADATPVPGGLPVGGSTVLSIPNNHLSYAVTWFGLALTLLGVFGVFAARRLKI